ncbi:unnamed protein product [Symbiodinium sp. CCMP2456]|nr:unnamed protein product [Symbiodinium sp. CCMP2456]
MERKPCADMGLSCAVLSLSDGVLGRPPIMAKAIEARGLLALTADPMPPCGRQISAMLQAQPLPELGAGGRRGRSSGPTATGQLLFRSGGRWRLCRLFQATRDRGPFAVWGSLRKENWLARHRCAQNSAPRKLCIATAG